MSQQRPAMNPDRSSMYNRNNPGRAGMIPEFAEGVTRFINHAMTLDDFLNSRLIRCPGSVYGYPEKAYQKKKSWYCGSPPSSFDGGDRETISTMESKIAYLNAELAAVAEREKKREEEIAAAKEVENKRYAALQAQLTFLFESGNILPTCPASSDGSDQEGDENDKSDKESEGDEE
ncbi:hypothetical protein H5410_056225 [Solanum commersonii]|uniref:Uncharacterized protein n=1 Tax=Solanum commersonii TaxID=4109 RepID=A0A9J5WJP1_SOLCO|nr:hypothetical protein H5410_056225 [Solanum commersonii]